MNRRRQHPAAAAARRARFYRPCGIEEKEAGCESAADSRGAPRLGIEAAGSSSRVGALSANGDGAAYTAAEDAA